MQRHRTIASAPKRTAAEAWETICGLIGDALERSSSIERDDGGIPSIKSMLISAGHLEGHPLVLVADDLWLEITTASGGPALSLEENLNPVPGGASATEWTLHVPQVEPMAKLVRATVKGHNHLSASEPTAASTQAATTSASVDLNALKRWAQEDA